MKIVVTDSIPLAHPALRGVGLLVALAIMLVGSVFPFFLVSRSGAVDHGFILVVLWAMSAGMVYGVGFTPRGWLWRWMFSGWACALALVLAGFLWFA